MSKIERINSPITYSPSGENIEIILNDENIWATKKSISDVFFAEIHIVTKHLENIFFDEELDESDNVKSMRIDGSSTPVKFYSLDAIISIGYRIDSKKATQFRIWATSVLKQYIKDGFVINEELLRSDPKKLNKLAAKIRELRANEKNVYASVRECFKISASDYSPSSKEVRRFYILLQDKFHHAITRMTSSKLVLDRANHADSNMGLQTMKSGIPTREEVKIGKNYLDKGEIYRMHLLSEQFLLYAESTALMNQEMTMNGLHEQLDNLLRLNGYPVFGGYKDFLKDEAMEHADKEYQDFIEIKKLEHIGINVDLELFYQGEYNEHKERTLQITNRQLNKAVAVQN